LLLVEEMVDAEMNKQFDIPIKVQKMMIDRKKSALMHPEKLVDWHTAKARMGIK
jgi:hypothetical protein